MRRRGRVRLNLKRGASAQVHGGVRYLEKAFSTTSPTQAWGQLKLVFEALHERKRLLENAPHLCSALPIMTVRAAPRRPWCTAACGARAHACAARQCARARQQSAAGRTVLAGVPCMARQQRRSYVGARAWLRARHELSKAPDMFWEAYCICVPAREVKLVALTVSSRRQRLSSLRACMRRPLSGLGAARSRATSGGRCHTTGPASRCGPLDAVCHPRRRPLAAMCVRARTAHGRPRVLVSSALVQAASCGTAKVHGDAWSVRCVRVTGIRERTLFVRLKDRKAESARALWCTQACWLRSLIQPANI